MLETDITISSDECLCSCIKVIFFMTIEQSTVIPGSRPMSFKNKYSEYVIVINNNKHSNMTMIMIKM